MPMTEPSAHSRAIAALVHDVFTALIQTGFTETQALSVITTMLVADLAHRMGLHP